MGTGVKRRLLVSDRGFVAYLRETQFDEVEAESSIDESTSKPGTFAEPGVDPGRTRRGL